MDYNVWSLSEMKIIMVSDYTAALQMFDKKNVKYYCILKNIAASNN